MQITFRYAKDEYLEYRQLNRVVPSRNWKRLLLVLLCLLPSFGLILCLQSLLATLAAGMFLFLFAVQLVMAVLATKPLVDQYDQHLTIDEAGIDMHRSYSQWQTSWDYFEGFETSDTFYLLRRLDRYTAIPKRSLDSQQTAEFLRLCARIENTGSSDAVSAATVPLFNELFNSVNQSVQHQFAYQPDDLSRATEDPLKIVEVLEPNESSAQKNKTKLAKTRRSMGVFWLMIMFGILLYMSLLALEPVPKGERWTGSQWAILAVAIVLPFLNIRVLNRWLRSRQKRNSQRMSDDVLLSMQLQTNGWAIGHPSSCQFFDWRDVKAFYQNSFCLGFHTCDDLVQLIPRRIFSRPEEAKAFLNQAINLRREHARSFATNVIAVETDNPYQPPSS